jgi:hypothetical protein
LDLQKILSDLTAEEDLIVRVSRPDEKYISDVAFAVFESEAVAVQLEDANVMGKAIEQRASETLGGEHARRPDLTKCDPTA